MNKKRAQLTNPILKAERARVKGKNPYILALVFSFVDIFTFVKYVHER